MHKKQCRKLTPNKDMNPNASTHQKHVNKMTEQNLQLAVITVLRLSILS